MRKHTHGIGTYCRHRADDGRCNTRNRRLAESSDDSVRSRRVRRLPRGNGSPRVPARSADARSGSASEEGGFIPATCSTGFGAAHQRRVS